MYRFPTRFPAIALSLALAWFSHPATAQNWGTLDAGNAVGLSGGGVCDTDPRLGQFCVTVGCDASSSIGIYVLSENLFRNGLRSATLSVDGRRIVPLDFQDAPGQMGLYRVPLDPGSAGSVLSALRSGNRFALRFQEGSDMVTFQGGLRNSRFAVDRAVQSCPPPAVAPPVPGAGNAGILPPPDPDNLPAVIDWVLESRGCEASEQEIHDEIRARSDIWTANQAIRFWTESPTFAGSYAAERRGYILVYRKIAGPRCG